MDDDLEFLNNDDNFTTTPKKKRGGKKENPKKSPSKNGPVKKRGAKKNILMPSSDRVKQENTIRSNIKKMEEAKKTWQKQNAGAIKLAEEKKRERANRIFRSKEEMALKRTQLEEEEKKKQIEIDEYIQNFKGTPFSKDAVSKIFQKSIEMNAVEGMQIIDSDGPADKQVRRGYVKMPLATMPLPPKFYKGDILYGDMVDFYYKVSDYETIELRGIVRNFTDKGIEIIGLDRKIYILSYDDETIVKRKSVYDKKKLSSDITLSEFKKTKVDEDDSSTSVRIFVARVIMNTLFPIVKNIMKEEKIPKLKDFNLSEDETAILRHHVIRFNDENVSCEYEPIFGNDYVKGKWKYSFSFRGMKIYEEILVPPFKNEKDMNPFLTEQSFFMEQFKKWLYVQIYNSKDEDAKTMNELSAKMANEQIDKFSDINYIVDLILIYFNHPQDDIYNTYPTILLDKMKENEFIGKLTDEQIENRVVNQYNLNQKSIPGVEARIKKYKERNDVNAYKHYEKVYEEITKSKEEMIKDLTQRRNIIRSVHKFYLTESLITYVRSALHRANHDKTRSDLMHYISVAVEEFVEYVKNFFSSEKDRKQLSGIFKHQLVSEYVDSFSPKNPKFSYYFDMFDSAYRQVLYTKYDEYFSKYIGAKQKFDEMAKKMKVYESLLKEGKKKTEESYGKDHTGRSDILSLVLTHEYQNTNITPRGYEILYEIREYEKKCFSSIPESKRTVEKYMGKVLYPFLFLQGPYLKHTNYFQKKLIDRDIKITSLDKMDFHNFFPEVAMQLSGENALDKRTIDKIHKRLEFDFQEYVDRTIEQYITSMDKTYVKTVSYVAGENFWTPYVTDISGKCSDIMKEDISNFTEKDTTVYYDTFTNSFVCYNIREVLKDIMDTDVYIQTDEEPAYKDKNGKIYPIQFIKRMKKTYKDILNKEEEEIESSSSKNLQLYFIYDSQLSDVYKNFMGSLDELYEKYTDINVVIQNKKDASQLIQKHSLHDLPVLVCFSGDMNTVLFKTKDLKTFMDELNQAMRYGYLPDKKLEYDPNIDFRKYDKDTIVQNIKNGHLTFPYAFYYMKQPYEFIGYKPYARLEKVTKKKTSDYGKILTYDDNDYEKLDILTNYFTEKARVLGVFTKDGNTKSLMELWKENAIEVVDKAFQYAEEKKTKVNAKAFREAIYQMRLPECTNFKISSAVAIFNEFKPKIVLDPFSGWGDRALGSLFAESVQKYIGVDPNSQLKEGYESIEKFAKEFYPEKSIRFVHSTIEDFDYSLLPERGADLIFSSPPYYNYEVYTEESSQSVKRYRSEKEWTEWFHKQTLILYNHLSKGGYLVYYLGTCGNLKIPSNLISYMERKVGRSAYRGAIETQSRTKKKRPLFYYVWQKK